MKNYEKLWKLKSIEIISLPFPAAFGTVLHQKSKPSACWRTCQRGQDGAPPKAVQSSSATEKGHLHCDLPRRSPGPCKGSVPAHQLGTSGIGVNSIVNVVTEHQQRFWLSSSSALSNNVMTHRSIKYRSISTYKYLLRSPRSSSHCTLEETWGFFPTIGCSCFSLAFPASALRPIVLP